MPDPFALVGAISGMVSIIAVLYGFGFKLGRLEQKVEAHQRLFAIVMETGVERLLRDNRAKRGSMILTDAAILLIPESVRAILDDVCEKMKTCRNLTRLVILDTILWRIDDDILEKLAKVTGTEGVPTTLALLTGYVETRLSQNGFKVTRALGNKRAR